jgi:MYXO-CTERM domain-containing protein
MRRTIARLIVCAAALGPAAARANGAFPDSLSILLPADRPHEIVLATNFGLLISEDDGASWHWVCEQAVASQARLYQMGPAPVDRLLAVSPLALVTSTDGACSWQVAQGALAGAQVTDAFPDPNDVMHVLALGIPPADAYTPPVVYDSHDGGATFQMLYTAPAGWSLVGVEVPRTAPQSLYVAAYEYVANQPNPYLLHSANAGTSFQMVNMTANLGTNALRLIAVDRNDPSRVYLRMLAPGADQFAIYDGSAAQMTLQLAGPMSFFLQREDGRLYTGTRDNAFVSSDSGRTFAPWPHAPHLRALGERGGVLYAAGDNYADHFAVAKSSDDGAHWQPLLSFDHICGMLACGQVEAICAAPWNTLVGTFQIPANVCGGGGAGGGAAGGGGCGCSVGRIQGAPALWILVLFLVCWWRRKR